MEQQSKPPAALFTNAATGEAYAIPEEGSLGLLALGHVGLLAWRENLKLTTFQKLSTLDAQQSKASKKQSTTNHQQPS